MLLPLRLIDYRLAYQFWDEKQGHHPSPSQQMPLQVMPERYKGENYPDVQ
jgi:hypothetical protein